MYLIKYSNTFSLNLLDILSVAGKRQDIIPNGFRSLIPKGCKVLNVSLNEGILTIDFSK